MLSGPTAFYTIIAAVRDANKLALANTVGGAPERVGVVPGAIAWDECDTCGVLALALVRTYLSDEFPIESSAPATISGTQGALLCADFVVQSVRCAPTPQGTSDAPSVDALDAAGQVVNADAYALTCSTLEALMTLYAADSIVDYLMRPATIVGPEGACVGTELTFSVAVIR
jgi:hypothetical protein